MRGPRFTVAMTKYLDTLKKEKEDMELGIPHKDPVKKLKEYVGKNDTPSSRPATQPPSDLCHAADCHRCHRCHRCCRWPHTF